MEPIRTWGISSRRGYVFEEAVEGSLRGSLFNIWGGPLYLSHSVYYAADGKDALDGSFLIVADSALGIGKLPDVRHVLASLSDDCSCLRTRNDSTNMDPGRLVMGGSGSHSVGRRGSDRGSSRSLNIGYLIRCGVFTILGFSGAVDLVVGIVCRDLDGGFRDFDIDIVVVLDLVESGPLCVRLITCARGR
ncbi:hypothetical protein HG530_005094 [Fusarium avenaceum]|nr:hypothetical protein HG530_005094 [Fusarium avenaceum]